MSKDSSVEHLDEDRRIPPLAAGKTSSVPSEKRRDDGEVRPESTLEFEPAVDVNVSGGSSPGMLSAELSELVELDEGSGPGFVTDEGVGSSGSGSGSNSSTGSPVEDGSPDEKGGVTHDFLALDIAKIKDTGDSHNAGKLKQFANLFLEKGFDPDSDLFNRSVLSLIKIRDHDGKGFLGYVIDSNNSDLARFLYHKFPEAKLQFNSMVGHYCADGNFDKVFELTKILPQGFVSSASIDIVMASNAKEYSSYLNDYRSYSDYFSANQIPVSNDFNFGLAVKSGCGPLNIAKMLKALTEAGYGGSKVVDDFGCSGLFYARNFSEYASMVNEGLVASGQNSIDDTVLDVMAQAIRSVHYNIERYRADVVFGEGLEDKRDQLENELVEKELVAKFLKRDQLENELVAKFLFGDFTWKDFSDLCSWYQLAGVRMVNNFFKSDFLERNSKILKSLDSDRFNLYEEVRLLRFSDLYFFFIRDSKDRLIFESVDAYRVFEKDLRRPRFDSDSLRDSIIDSDLLPNLLDMFKKEDRQNLMRNLAQSVNLTLRSLWSNFDGSEYLDNDGVYVTLFHIIKSDSVSDEKKLQSLAIVKQMMDCNIVSSKKHLHEIIFSSIDNFLKEEGDYLDILRLLPTQQDGSIIYVIGEGAYTELLDVIESDTTGDEKKLQLLGLVKKMLDLDMLPMEEDLHRVVSYFLADYFRSDEEAVNTLRKLLFSGIYNLDKALIKGGEARYKEFVMAFIAREVPDVSSFAQLADFQNVIFKRSQLHEIENVMLMANLLQIVNRLHTSGIVPQDNLEFGLAIEIIESCIDICYNSGIYNEDYNITTGSTSYYHTEDVSPNPEYLSLMSGKSWGERKAIADRFCLYREVDDGYLSAIDLRGLAADLIVKSKASFGNLNHGKGRNKSYVDGMRSLVLERVNGAGPNIFDCVSDKFDPMFYMTFFRQCVNKGVFPDTEERFEVALKFLSTIWNIAKLKSTGSLFSEEILKDEVEDVMISFQEGCMDQLGSKVYDFLPTPNDPVFAFRLIKKLCIKDLLPDSQERLDIAIEYLNSFYCNLEGEDRDVAREEAVELASSLVTSSGFGVDISSTMQKRDFVTQIAKKIGNSDFIFSSKDIEAKPATYRRFSVGGDMRGQSLDQIRAESKREMKKITKFPDAKPLSRGGKDRSAALTVLFASLLFGL